MSKLYFYYSTMDSGKSTMLIQTNHNYNERGFSTAVFTYSEDTRGFSKSTISNTKVASRVGLSLDAIGFDSSTDFSRIIDKLTEDSDIKVILIDEAQFLTEDQVKDLSDIVDYKGIPVLCYGLRTDFQGNLFEGSKWLLAWADKLVELKTICYSGIKATHVLRLTPDKEVVTDGDQVVIGDNSMYQSVSRAEWKNRFNKALLDKED